MEITNSKRPAAKSQATRERVAALLDGRPLADVAQAAGVSLRTVHRIKQEGHGD